MFDITFTSGMWDWQEIHIDNCDDKWLVNINLHSKGKRKMVIFYLKNVLGMDPVRLYV